MEYKVLYTSYNYNRHIDFKTKLNQSMSFDLKIILHNVDSNVLLCQHKNLIEKNWFLSIVCANIASTNNCFILSAKKENEEEFWTIQLNVERSIRLWKHVTQPFECRFSLDFQFMSETYGFCLFAYVNICVVIIIPIELSKFRFVILFWHVIILLDMHMQCIIYL